MAADKRETREVLQKFLSNLELVLSQVSSGDKELEDVEEFDPQVYWQHVSDTFKVISHEVTKLSLMFSSVPYPTKEAAEALLADLSRGILSLLTLFCGFPKSQGHTVHGGYRRLVLHVLEEIKSLSAIIARGDLGLTEQLKSTGIVWAQAKSITDLPKNNIDAVASVITESENLVTDAVQEMAEELDGPQQTQEPGMFDDFCPDQDLPSWTNADRTLLNGCLGLMKVSRSLTKKVKDVVKHGGKCYLPKYAYELDTVADYVQRLSPVVDELSSNIYPPVDHEEMQKNSESLFHLHSSILSFVRNSHVTGEADQKWVEFLQTANQHNMDKINTHPS